VRIGHAASLEQHTILDREHGCRGVGLRHRRIRAQRIQERDGAFAAHLADGQPRDPVAKDVDGRRRPAQTVAPRGDDGEGEAAPRDFIAERRVRLGGADCEPAAAHTDRQAPAGAPALRFAA
jgi:hypothetical protein